MKLVKSFRFEDMKRYAGRFLIYANNTPLDNIKTTWMGRMKTKGDVITLDWSGWLKPNEIIILGSFKKLKTIKSRVDRYENGIYVLDAKTFKKAKEELERFLVMEAL